MTVGVACGESERSNGDGGGSGGIQSAGGNGAQGGGGTSGLGNGGDPSLGSGGTEPVGKPQIIDTHIHLWDLARDPQFDDGMTRLPADYETQARDAGITGCVLVEAVWSTLGDNQWGLQLAEENQFIVGVVGSLPVSSDQFLTNVATLASHSLFRGLRLGSVADLGSAKMSALIDRGLSVDVNVNGPEAILQLAAAAAAVPDLTVILDHAGGLSFVDTPSQAWVDAMHQLAANPNVVCKFSRFQEQAGSTPATIMPR